MTTSALRQTKKVISINLDLVDYRQVIDRIVEWGKAKQAAYVCFANVHMTIEAYKDENYATAVNNAALVLPDGVPLVKSLKFFYGLDQERIAGMDIFPDLIRSAELNGLKIFFFGTTDELLEKIRRRTEVDFPKVDVVGTLSPPFDQSLDDHTYIERIRNSGADLVFVALGCPKQEKWMAKHSPRINATLLGVGGAFPVYAGVNQRAPSFMRNNGLEWFYRLYQEPGRLFMRYLTTNSLFIYLALKTKLRMSLKKVKPL